MRPGEFVLPQACCRCLASPDTVYESPFRVNDTSDIAAPLCRACASTLHRRWWAVAALTATATLAAAAAAVLAIPGLDAFGRFFLFGFLGLLGGCFAVAIIPNRVCRPYVMRVLDADRGIFHFATRNPAYDRLPAEQRRESTHAHAIERLRP